mgnify:CR=1 FL=1
MLLTIASESRVPSALKNPTGFAIPDVAARYGAPGTVLIGLGLEAVGVLILVLLMVIAAPLNLYGLSLGFASAQLTGTMLRDIPVYDSRQASATQTTVCLGQWCRP